MTALPIMLRTNVCRCMYAVILFAIYLPLLSASLCAQQIVESKASNATELKLSAEPVVRIGVLEGPLEYMFGRVSGAIRLNDGSVVVADEQNYEVRMFDSQGRHMWSSGREGQGPGEYEGLRLLGSCSKDAITVFDWRRDRITELDLQGNMIYSRSLNTDGINPYGQPKCSPNGGLVFTPWPEEDYGDFEVGENYRWQMSLIWAQFDSMMTLQTGIPGPERFYYGGGTGPKEWGKNMVFAVSPNGVWFGSADGYELQLVDWEGRIARIARWEGSSLEVNDTHLARYRQAYEVRYNTPEELRRFESNVWPEIRENLPKRFPAIESDGLMALPDGSLIVVTFRWRAPEIDVYLLNPNGNLVSRFVIPPRSTLLDAGADWVLLLERGESDEHSVTVYGLTRIDDSE